MAEEQNVPHMLQRIAEATGGTLDSVHVLPDGHGFATMSLPLPKDHWLYAGPDAFDTPPMSMRCGTDDPRRRELAEQIEAAGRYAVRAATYKGREMDFDPDALVRNIVIGLLGYYTPDGLSGDAWANPNDTPPLGEVPA